MFEHEQIDGKKIRLLPAQEEFINQEILEIRDSIPGKSDNDIARLQYAVVGDLLVQRFLPAESVGDMWEYDSVASPWWEVVSHPPHAGIVADFNKSCGGLYIRKLDPENNVVAFASGGEPVVMVNYEYSVEISGGSITAADMRALRAAYYAALSQSAA